jgi:oxygen-dependent protoporphyrinogen oxidase
MLGSLDPRKNKVTIVGAGISGLLIGYVLKKRGFEVRIFEASSRTGGLIRTQKTLYGISEKAAHSFLVSPEIQSFFDELKLDLIPVNADAKARFIVRDGKMRRMPLSFKELIQTVVRVFSKPKTAFSSQTASLADWCLQYLGPAANRYLLSPFVTGVFACTPEELNAKISFPKLIPTLPHQSFFRFLRSKPKNKAARPKMMVIREGTEKLIERLTEELKNEIRLETPIQDLKKYFDTNLILTVPAPSLIPLIESFDAPSAEALAKVRYSPLVSVTAFYREQDFQSSSPRGVGVLIPRNEGYRMLGCLFNSSSFPARAISSFVSLTVMIGGTTDRDAVRLTDGEIQTLVDSELRKLLHTNAPPTHLEIARWNHAIPVFSNELKNAQESLFRGFCASPGHMIFSNYSKDVSIRGMIETLLKL